jgi:hypothetical protein
VWRELAPGSLEVIGIDVRPARVTISERLDEHVLVRVVQAARPIEPQAAGLGARRLGEDAADLGPAIGKLRLDQELRGNKDHRVVSRSGW